MLVPKILIIDDSSFQRKNLRRILAQDGYDILEASEGQQGLDMIQAESPDCILTDLFMPEVDGLDVLRSLRDQGSSTPVIVLSADIQEDAKRECWELGARFFITKPVDHKEVQNLVKKALDLDTERFS